VLDAGRSLDEHVASLGALAESEGAAPAALIQGLGAGRQAAASAVTELGRRGWAVVELPGFAAMRLVLPGGRRVLESATLERILERLSATAPGAAEQRRADVVAERTDQLEERVRALELRLAEAEAGRELAQRRQATTEDVVVTLRAFRDEARAELGRAHQQTDDFRRQLEAARADVTVARARNDRFSRVQRSVREDLVRLQVSQAWRLGHWLTRAGRILTFRKPGRTDAVSRALERLDQITPSGDARD
jgi:hypothetical protein